MSFSVYAGDIGVVLQMQLLFMENLLLLFDYYDKLHDSAGQVE
jgi:hypothetical protein